jgi:hypothetical protein
MALQDGYKDSMSARRHRATYNDIGHAHELT